MKKLQSIITKLKSEPDKNYQTIRNNKHGYIKSWKRRVIIKHFAGNVRIFVSLLCAGIKPKDKVTIPAFTFIAVSSL